MSLNNVKPGENKKSSDHKNEMNILLILTEAPLRLADNFGDFLFCINAHLAASFSSCK